MQTNKARSPEETEQQKEDFAAGEIVSFRFMRRHADFKSTKANAEVIGKYVKDHNLPWNDESVEEAYDKCRDQIEHGDTTVAPYKQQQPFADLTLIQIKAMPLPEYKQNLKRKDFRAALKRLGIGGV